MQRHGHGAEGDAEFTSGVGNSAVGDAYPTMARAMGVDPATGQYIPLDITNKNFAMNYLDLVHHPLERQGS